uniref:Cilia- and flagella-associated protein 206 n=1 Tax=Timema cristinae TaxID=61476 RepID=A0A7R9D5Z2_TIMCR|nr:unnamed protein product [Timema cristinae]
MVLLNNINNILWNLHSYTEVMDHTDNEVLKMMLGDAEVLTDADRLEASMGQTIHRRKTINCGVVDPSVVADFDRIPLQYLGFCAWTFVEGRGALIPANQNMGVLRWNGNYYAFSSPDAAYQFDQDPEKGGTMVILQYVDLRSQSDAEMQSFQVLRENNHPLEDLTRKRQILGQVMQETLLQSQLDTDPRHPSVPILHILCHTDGYIKAAANLARVHPELINLLQLHEQMVASRSLGEYRTAQLSELESVWPAPQTLFKYVLFRLPPRLPEPLMKRDIEMQTELHPIPSYIDPNYTWNEWELKRKAIQLANICKSKTHSTQTNNSHKRASIGVQAQQPKDVGCQTKRDIRNTCQQHGLDEVGDWRWMKQDFVVLAGVSGGSQKGAAFSERVISIALRTCHKLMRC